MKLASIQQFILHDLTVQVGHKKICEHVHAIMRPGEVWGILGPNGCGKTTLLHTFAGLKKVTGGEIKITLANNKNIDKDADKDADKVADKVADATTINLETLSRKTLAQYLAILFQHLETPFAQSVLEFCLAARYPHLDYFKRESEYDMQIVKQALNTMSLSHAHDIPITKLSGGELQRLNIACMIAQSPQIFLLDEPTNHLDIHHQYAVLNYFRARKTEVVIMALHDINFAYTFCDYVMLLLNEGDSGDVLIGKPEEIFTNELLSKLYRHPIAKVVADDGQTFWCGVKSSHVEEGKPDHN